MQLSIIGTNYRLLEFGTNCRLGRIDAFWNLGRIVAWDELSPFGIWDELSLYVHRFQSVFKKRKKTSDGNSRAHLLRKAPTNNQASLKKIKLSSHAKILC